MRNFPSWASVEQFCNDYPNCYLKHNMKTKGWDFAKMYENDYPLFDRFARIFSGAATPDLEQLWTNVEIAYKELKEQGLYELDFTNMLKTKANKLSHKLQEPCLIPKEVMSKTATEQTKKGKKSYQFDYNELTEAIEKYYGITTRGYWDELKDNLKSNIEKELLEIDDKTIKSLRNKNAKDSLLVAKIGMISDFVEERIPYVDFWHDLMNNDFGEVSNGSVVYMNEPDEETDDNTTNYLFATIKKIFFKEVAPIAGETDCIEFYVCW